MASCGPFGNAAVAGICFVVWSSMLTVTVLFPLTGFMVLEYGAAHAREDVGYLAGVLGSCYLAGRALTCAPWGAAADRWGMVPILALCSVLSGLGTAAMGFVDGFAAAVVLRLVTGLLNPVVALVKGLLPDMVSEEEQHHAMSLVTAQWEFGLISGPVIGGLLAYPCRGHDASHLPVAMRWMLCERPFLMPMFACGLLQILGVVPLLRLVRPKLRRDSAAAQAREGGASQEARSVGGSLRLKRKGKRRSRDYAPLHDEGGVANEASEVSLQVMQADLPGSLPEELPSCPDGVETGAPEEEGEAQEDEENKEVIKSGNADKGADPAPSEPPMSMLAMLLDPGYGLLLGFYCFFSVFEFTGKECDSLLAMTPSESGGLGGEAADTGRVFSAAGVSSLIFQLTFGPRIVKRLGLVRGFKMGLVASGVCIMLIPFIPQVLPVGAGQWRFAALAAAISARTCSEYMAFSSLFVLLNNSVPPNCRGRANGLSMAVSSAVKSVGPPLGTIIFAWSVNLQAGFPFDAHFLFISLGAASLLCAAFAARRLPDWAAAPYHAQPLRARGK